MSETIDVIRFTGDGQVTIPKELVPGAAHDIRGQLRLSAVMALTPSVYRDGNVMYLDRTKTQRVGVLYGIGTDRVWVSCQTTNKATFVETEDEAVTFVEQQLKEFIEVLTRAWS